MAKTAGDDGRYNESLEKAATRAVLMGEKKLKSDVHYRYQSEDSKKVCFECEWYCKEGEPTSDCEKVVGLVSAQGVCDLWKEREEESKDSDGDNDNDSPAVQIVINVGQGR